MSFILKTVEASDKCVELCDGCINSKVGEKGSEYRYQGCKLLNKVSGVSCSNKGVVFVVEEVKP